MCAFKVTCLANSKTVELNSFLWHRIFYIIKRNQFLIYIFLTESRQPLFLIYRLLQDLNSPLFQFSGSRQPPFFNL